MSHQGLDLAASRAHAPHTSMFLRMLVRAAVLRRGRAASALFAMVVAAAVATAMLNLYVDVQAKLQREFRNYGANIILVGKAGTSLPAGALSQVDSVLVLKLGGVIRQHFRESNFRVIVFDLSLESAVIHFARFHRFYHRAHFVERPVLGLKRAPVRKIRHAKVLQQLFIERG